MPSRQINYFLPIWTPSYLIASEANEIFFDNPAVYDGDEVVEDDNGGVRTIPNSCRPAANNNQRQLHKNSEGSEDYSESYSESDSDTGSWLQKRDNIDDQGAGLASRASKI